MELNVKHVQRSQALQDVARQLISSAVRMAEEFIARDAGQQLVTRGGAKAHNPVAASATTPAQQDS